MGAQPGGIRARYEKQLSAFVLRARRVKEHSLARDRGELARMQNPQYKITGRTDSHLVTIRTEYPPEEQVESAAARIRPLLLEGDDTHYAKAMNALLYFAYDAGAGPEVIAQLRDLRKEWITVASEKTKGLTYEVRLKQGDAPEEALSDRGLAFAWIYGDVVHADADRRDGAHVFGVEERFHAAVPLIAKLMVLAIRTLEKIEFVHGRRGLAFLHDAFAEDVVVTRQIVEREAEAWVAPYDEEGLPPVTPVGEEMGDGWTRFGDEFGPEGPAAGA